MKPDALGGREAVTLCATLIILNAFHPVTALVRYAAGPAAWLSQLISLGVGVAYALVITAICSAMRKRRADGAAESMPGRAASVLMCALSLFYAVEVARYMLRTLSFNLLPAMPAYVKALMLILVCLPAVLRGINPVARVARLVRGVMLLGVVLLAVSVYGYATPSNFTPLMGYGAGGILTGAAAASFAFFPLCFIGFMEDKIEGSMTRVTVTSAALGGAGLLLLAALHTLAFPYSQPVNTEMPLQALLFELDFSVHIGRIQGVYLMLYVMAATLGVGASLALCSRLFCRAFGVRRQIWPSLGLAALLFALCVLPADAMPEAAVSLTGPSIYHALIPVAGVAALALRLAGGRKKVEHA